jgi:predicted transcriptional regulator of viral defense system
MQMQTVTEIALEQAPSGVFSRTQASCWLNAKEARLDGLLKRAVKSGEVLRVRQGLFCLSRRYLRAQIHPFALAQFIYGPSYISLESALSHHGWIPEAVHSVTSVSDRRSKDFATPLGSFAFARIPQTTLFAGVERVAGQDGKAFFIATPLKALADYVYLHTCDWISAEPVLSSLRVEPEALQGLPLAMFEELVGVHGSERVRRFLDGLRKDLKR